MPYLIAILLLPLLAALFYAFTVFDRLLRAEYEQHRPAWETDGRPAGFFWRAQECNFITSHLARARISFALFFRTPAWIVGSPVLVALLRRHRFAVLVWNIGILVWSVFLLSVLHD
jgi:hypothetical protein